MSEEKTTGDLAEVVPFSSVEAAAYQALESEVEYMVVDVQKALESEGEEKLVAFACVAISESGAITPYYCDAQSGIRLVGALEMMKRDLLDFAIEWAD